MPKFDLRLPNGKILTVQADDADHAMATAGDYWAKNPDPKGAQQYQAAVKEAKARSMAGANGTDFANALGSFGNGAAYGFLNDIDATRVRGQTMVENAIRGAIGKPQRFTSDQAARATKQVDAEQSAEFAKRHPVIDFASQMGGSIIAPGLVKGGAAVNAGKGLLAKSAISAGVGATAGAAYGAGGAQDGHRLQGATHGAEAGAVLGLVAPAAGKYVVGPVANTVARTANKVVNGLSGGNLNVLSPKQQAGKMLSAALKKDGATPDQARAILNKWMISGASDPTLIDMASQLPSGGQTTLGLVRGAALKASPARGLAVKYGDQVASDLQPNAIRHTMNLTPHEMRPAGTVRSALQEAHQQLATEQYGAPYAQQVNAGPVVPALSGQAGARGISAAATEADAMALRPEVADRIPQLQALRRAALPQGDSVPQLSGPDGVSPEAEAWAQDLLGGKSSNPTTDLGTLDRIKVALNNAGQAAAEKGRMGEASGYFERAKLIDDHLALNSRDYAAARDAYAIRAQGLDSLDAGLKGYATTPEQLAAMTPNKDLAGVGFRQTLVDHIGAPGQSGRGVLNTIGTSASMGQKLADLYGPDAADLYRSAINNERQRVANANFINPNTGSQTAGREADSGAEMLDTLSHVASGKWASLAQRILKGGVTLTDQEREALLHMALGPARLPETQVRPNLMGPVLPAVAGNYARQAQ